MILGERGQVIRESGLTIIELELELEVDLDRQSAWGWGVWKL